MVADALIMIPLEIVFLGYLNFVFVSFGEKQRTGYPETRKGLAKFLWPSGAHPHWPSFGPGGGLGHDPLARQHE